MNLKSKNKSGAKGLFNSTFKESSAGFTLVELLVVVTIFVVLLLMIINVFILTQKREREILAQERALSSARLLLEKIAQDVRITQPNYQVSWPSSALYLIDQEGNEIIYQKSNQCPAGISSCVVMTHDGGVNWPMVSGTQIIIRDLNFYIYPEEDPFTYDPGSADFGSNIQPRVTIFLRAIPADDSWAEDIEVQTTVSSRVYLR